MPPVAVETDPRRREEHAIAGLKARLHQRFPTVPQSKIDASVAVARQKFEGSRIRDFVPIFVERNVRDELDRKSS